MFCISYIIRKVKDLFSGGRKFGAVVIGRRKAFPRTTRNPVPAPTPVTPPAAPKLIEHVLNDPTTPDMYKLVPAPTPPAQNLFVVRGYKGGGFPHGSVEYQAANGYVTIAETLNLFNRDGVKTPHWRRTSTLNVYPRAGVDLNAYYDGRSLRFFYATDPRIGTVYTADAADIVSHECGHGILDCFRPDLWDAAYIEAGAFHESFGDFCAIMHALHHDEMIDKALAETAGDLSKSNVVSRLAEQFGAAIYKLDPTSNPVCLRDAANTFRYVDPGTLPKDAADGQLAGEVHSFSRVMTGALYDILVGIYNDLKGHGLSPREAVRVARDTLLGYVTAAVQNAPLNAKFFESVAKTILWADAKNNAGKYAAVVQRAFAARNIATPQLRMLSAPKCPNDDRIVTSQSHMAVKLSDYVVRAQGQDDNPLYDVEVQLPVGEANLYDANGFIHDSITVTHEETIRAAVDFIHFLHASHGVGGDEKTPWEVRDGKLVRTRTCCSI
jgi:hypothetical protein